MFDSMLYVQEEKFHYLNSHVFTHGALLRRAASSWRAAGNEILSRLKHDF